MIPVGRLAPVHQWDQTMLDDLFTNRLYPTGLEFRRWEGYPGYPTADGCILLIPGRYWAGHEAEISMATARYEWLLLMVTGDEEADFDARLVEHPNVRFWIQSPRKDHTYPDGARFFPIGYTPHTRMLPTEPPIKSLDVFLSAQRTHIRRIQAFDALEGSHLNQRVEATGGFTQGMDPAEYVDCMSIAKIAPCPSGAVSPDTFRAFEALEAHAIPICDTVSPVDGPTDYWGRVLPGYPFPTITDYGDLAGYCEDMLAGWPANSNRIVAWWCRYKRSLARGLRDDLEALGAL